MFNFFFLNFNHLYALFFLLKFYFYNLINVQFLLEIFFLILKNYVLTLEKRYLLLILNVIIFLHVKNVVKTKNVAGVGWKESVFKVMN